MQFMDSIISWLAIARDMFADAYIEVSGWPYPFYYLATPFWWLYRAFVGLIVSFTEFKDWVAYADTRVGVIVGLVDIYIYFQVYFLYAIDAWNWVVNAFGNVSSIVNSWWLSTQATVLGWIQEAENYATDLFNQVTDWSATFQQYWDDFWTITYPSLLNRLSSLDQAWDEFWTTTFPTLATWAGISGFIDSAIKSWFPFYEDIVEFFYDPWEWLWTRFVNWFLGGA